MEALGCVLPLLLPLLLGSKKSFLLLLSLNIASYINFIHVKSTASCRFRFLSCFSTTLFSRGHATLHLDRSVGPSVRPSVGRSVTFLNSEWFSHYCSCPTIRDWIAVNPALFFKDQLFFSEAGMSLNFCEFQAEMFIICP